MQIQARFARSFGLVLVCAWIATLAGCFLFPAVDPHEPLPTSVDLGHSTDYVITGTVRDAAGIALPNMRMYVHVQDFERPWLYPVAMTWFRTDENGRYEIAGAPNWNLVDAPNLDVRFTGTEDVHVEELQKTYEQLWYRDIQQRVSGFPVSNTSMVVDFEVKPVDDTVRLKFTVDPSLSLDDMAITIDGVDGDGRSCALLACYYNDQPHVSYDASTGVVTIEQNLAGSQRSTYHQLNISYPYSSGYRTRILWFNTTTIDAGINDLGLIPIDQG